MQVDIKPTQVTMDWSCYTLPELLLSQKTSLPGRSMKPHVKKTQIEIAMAINLIVWLCYIQLR